MDSNYVNEVKDFYNNLEDYSADFCQRESRIKGLRAFNNWVKAALIHNSITTLEYQSLRQNQSPQDQLTPVSSQAFPGLRVLDIGCGKGGDLNKWFKIPGKVEVYHGLDPAGVSIQQARERWSTIKRSLESGDISKTHVEFFEKDCFRESLMDIPAIREIGFATSEETGGGFDIASMMFCMHYAFESEYTVRKMLENISGALKTGGRLIGCVPSSQVIGQHFRDFEDAIEMMGLSDYRAPAEWGNGIYNVRFPKQAPRDGVFGWPFGDSYFFSLAEAVEASEFVVPWDEFCDIAAEYGLESRYCMSFGGIWEDDRDAEFLGGLSRELGVVDADGRFLVSGQEMEAIRFYHAFCFQKV